MKRILCTAVVLVLTVGPLSAAWPSLAAAGPSPGDSAVTLAPSGVPAVKAQLQPEPPKRAARAFWVMVGLAILAALVSVALRAAGPWAVALLAGGILATVCLMWTRPPWMPAVLVLPLLALVAVVSVRYRLRDHLHGDEPEGAVSFLTGVILCSAAAYLAHTMNTGWTRTMVYVLLAFAALLLFFWKLKEPVALWVTAMAIGHLGLVAFNIALTTPSYKKGLLLLGGALAVVGIAGTTIRGRPLAVVISAQLVVAGAVIALAGTATGLVRPQVGWTVAVGLPLVQFGLGLALSQRLGAGETGKRDVQ